MIEASFYLFSTQKDYYVCVAKVIDKIYRLDKKSYIVVNDSNEAQKLDSFLWEYPKDNFIPHEIYDATEKTVAPILIGHASQTNAPEAEVLINLANCVPSYYQQYQRIVEIVVDDAQLKQQSREKYKFYQANGVKVVTHAITS